MTETKENTNQAEALVLNGAPVSKALMEKLCRMTEECRKAGVTPTLAVVRVGEKTEDLAYERTVRNRCEKAEIRFSSFVLPVTASTEDVCRIIRQINEDDQIHGVLLFSPLPKHMEEEKVRNLLKPEKDLDGITPLSKYGIYAGQPVGYPPCTPEACLRILDYYGIDVEGKRVTVVGRSLVVGRPLAMMLMGRNATVTICHTRSKNMEELCREADVVVATAGRPRLLGPSFFRKGQVVLDVGINDDGNGGLCGDVDFDGVLPLVDAITPVPGGVGSVTTNVLLTHLAEACEKRIRKS